MKKLVTFVSVVVASLVVTSASTPPVQAGICDYLPPWACSEPPEEPCGGKGHHELCPG